MHKTLKSSSAGIDWFPLMSSTLLQGMSVTKWYVVGMYLSNHGIVIYSQQTKSIFKK